MPGTQKQGKKGKRPRKPKFSDPNNATRRNLKREIHKAEKKIDKLLRIRKEGRKLKNQTMTLKNEDGVVRDEFKQPVKVEHKTVRLQGMKEGGIQHKRLQGHIQRLKNRLEEVKDARAFNLPRKSLLK